MVSIARAADPRGPLALAGWAVLLALPAGAGDGEFVPGPYIEILAECYGAAETRAARASCIGEASDICIEEEPRGRTERGRIECWGIEADAWDVVLEGEYQLTMEWTRDADAADRSTSPDLPRRQDALRAAQQAWEEFFDAECRLGFVRSGAMEAANCRLQMIAERAIALKALRDR